MFFKKDERKKIAVLTSGGDAPGMNAAVRAVVRTGLESGYRVIGIKRGYSGLLENAQDNFEFDLRGVSNIISNGGTLLYTARSLEFATPEGVARAAKYCKDNDIVGLVVVGGDGTFRGARDLSKHDINCIALPGTIDNDISSSEYTIGFDTAMNTAMRMIDNIRDTTQSHDRCSIVEVMGRHAGYLALETGIATGASAILVPEVAFNIEQDIYPSIEKALEGKKHHFIIVVAEGVEYEENGVKYGGSSKNSFAQFLADKIEEKFGIESRATVLGHVQRGGSPTVRDRVIATQMGNYAVELLKQNKSSRVVAVKDGRLVDYDIDEALAMKKEFPKDVYDMAHVVSI